MGSSRSGGVPPGEAGVRKKRAKRKSKHQAGRGEPQTALANPAGGAAVSTPEAKIGMHDAARPAGEGGGTAVGGGGPRSRSDDISRSTRKRRRRGLKIAKPGGNHSPDRQSAAGRIQLAGDSARHPQAGKRHKSRKPHMAEAGSQSGHRHFRAPVRPAPDPSFTAGPAAGKSGVVPAVAQNHHSSAQSLRKRGNWPGERQVFAALDLGTNNCRLLMAAPDGPMRFKVVDAFSRIVRLGEGMAVTGLLQEDAMQRTMEALAVCAAKLASQNLAGKRLIATEACRTARNGAAFVSRVRECTGIELEIVDRKTEARLAAEGCGGLIDPGAEAAVLFDIGGGSTELILVRKQHNYGSRISGHIAGWTSLPVGVVNLSERHGGIEVSQAAFDAMVEEVVGHLGRFEQRNRLDDIWHNGRTHLLGTSGTVTTIAGLHLELPRYDRRKVDGIWLSDVEVNKVIGDLKQMDYEMRARNPCIGRERADLVLAGCAILQAIQITWPSPRLRVADRGLREGILNELMHDAGVWRRSDNSGGWNKPQRRSVPANPPESAS